MTVLLGITGGIAAYKAAELVRLFQQRGWRVRVMMTQTAAAFVQPLTFVALTGEKVFLGMFAEPGEPNGDGDSSIEHIGVARSADAVVIAPATAHTLARLAHGLADDFLTTACLASPAPLLAAPAMNVEMWRHPATQANLELLRRRGARIVEPASGYLACGMVGAGRMADPEAIVEATLAAVSAAALTAVPRDLEGETVLVTAGPTREPLDPVRFLSNRSSGRMGYALAEAAAARGARVVLVSGPVALTPPPGVETVPVRTAAEMAAACEDAFPRATLAVFAAAVSDYRAARVHPDKIKKTGGRLLLELEPTPDILATLARRKGERLIVGFAAETDAPHALDAARAKLRDKNADLIVLNDVGRAGIGFDAEQNAVTLVSRDDETELARAPKREIADRILDRALALRRTVGAPA